MRSHELPAAEHRIVEMRRHNRDSIELAVER
jgi:hypothetical protein